MQKWKNLGNHNNHKKNKYKNGDTNILNLFFFIFYFRAYKVVSPNWIIDSKKAGKQLNWKNYRLIKNQSNQKELLFNGKREHNDNSSITPTSLTTVSKSISASTLTSASTHCNNNNINTNNNSTKNKYKLNQSIPQTNNNTKNSNLTNSYNKNNNASINIIQQQSTHPSNLNNEPSTSIIKLQQQGIENNLANRDSYSNINIWDRNHSSMHPDFIKNYYKSSRLHYLSAMREELKDIVRKAEHQQSNLKSSYSNNSNSSKEGLQSYIMHVDFDCFFTSVGIKDRPELKDQPVI